MSSSLSFGTYKALEVTCRVLREYSGYLDKHEPFLALFFLFVCPLLPDGYGVGGHEGFELIKQSSDFEQCSSRKLE
ncbi:hypothetical protein CEXT_623261 [Caerostris extrusa]|uniref:Uncharacterized protein n=1 Tax=Caerostris extrusa TaxID=172846 RepID=A0AAV4SYF2_CAEEX|nr:hypothetical protein CEXT_623261 [Caerostris extrusa]